jgi:hypothetical protein
MTSTSGVMPKPFHDEFLTGRQSRSGIGVIGIILIVLVVLLLMGRI